MSSETTTQYWLGGYAWKDTDPRKISGVYALFLGEKLQYIGKSENVIHRIHGHVNKRTIPFDRAKIFECPRTEMSQVEMKLIRANQPEHNIHGTGRKQRNGKALPPDAHGYWERPIEP